MSPYPRLCAVVDPIAGGQASIFLPCMDRQTGLIKKFPEDRIIFFGFKLEKLPGSLPIEVAAFLIANAVIAILLLKDYKKKLATRTLLTCLLIFIIGQGLYFTVPVFLAPMRGNILCLSL